MRIYVYFVSLVVVLSNWVSDNWVYRFQKSARSKRVSTKGVSIIRVISESFAWKLLYRMPSKWEILTFSWTFVDTPFWSCPKKKARSKQQGRWLGSQSSVRGRHGGVEKREGWKTSRMTPLPKTGFGAPLVRYVFHPPRVSVLCFSCTKIHGTADQKLFWRGPKIFGRARSLVRFPPPVRFAPPHITW